MLIDRRELKIKLIIAAESNTCMTIGRLFARSLAVDASKMVVLEAWKQNLIILHSFLYDRKVLQHLIQKTLALKERPSILIKSNTLGTSWLPILLFVFEQVYL